MCVLLSTRASVFFGNGAYTWVILPPTGLQFSGLIESVDA